MYCTHIMSEVERLCDHVAVIHDGVIKGEGTVDDLKKMSGQTSLERAFLYLVGELNLPLSLRGGGADVATYS